MWFHVLKYRLHLLTSVRYLGLFLILGSLTGILSGGRSETYEDIDRPNRQETTGGQSSGGYDFSSAQQI